MYNNKIGIVRCFERFDTLFLNKPSTKTPEHIWIACYFSVVRTNDIFNLFNAFNFVFLPGVVVGGGVGAIKKTRYDNKFITLPLTDSLVCKCTNGLLLINWKYL